MKQWVKDILEVQTADMRTKRMNSRLKNIPVEKREIQTSLIAEQTKLASLKDKMKAYEKEIKAIEARISDVNAKVDDLNKKSAMIKKNEEYKLMLNEIAKQKFLVSSLETTQLKVYDQLETDKKLVSAAEKSLKNIQLEIESSIKELEELEKTLQTEINAALEKRKPMLEKLEKLNPEILPIYIKLIKRDGEPLSRIHNNTCGFCHLKLIPQTLNDAKKGLAVACDTCGHLIYFHEE